MEFIDLPIGANFTWNNNGDVYRRTGEDTAERIAFTVDGKIVLATTKIESTWNPHAWVTKVDLTTKGSM